MDVDNNQYIQSIIKNNMRNYDPEILSRFNLHRTDISSTPAITPAITPTITSLTPLTPSSKSFLQELFSVGKYNNIIIGGILTSLLSSFLTYFLTEDVCGFELLKKTGFIFTIVLISYILVSVLIDFLLKK